MLGDPAAQYISARELLGGFLSGENVQVARDWIE